MQHYFQYIKNYLNVSFEEIVTWLALRLQLEESNRAIINQMLEANWDCLFFYFPGGWSEKPLPPSQQIRCKTGT